MGQDRLRAAGWGVARVTLFVAFLGLLLCVLPGCRSADAKRGLGTQGRERFAWLLASRDAKQFDERVTVVAQAGEAESILILTHALLAAPYEKQWWRNVKEPGTTAGLGEGMFRVRKVRVALELWSSLPCPRFHQLIGHYFEALEGKGAVENAGTRLLDWTAANKHRFVWDAERKRFRAICRPFSGVAWRRGSVEVRGTMAPGIIDSQLLMGKTRDDVKKLLGPPDNEGESLVLYEVDPGRFFGFPHFFKWYLEMQFDEKTGRVKNVGFADD